MISRRAIRLAGTVSAATLLLTLASCATYTAKLATNTVGLPLCDAHNTPKTRFLVTIRLDHRVDAIFDHGPQAVQHVFYTVLPAPQEPSNLRDTDPEGRHISSAYPNVEANLYDSDLSLFSGIERGDFVEYQVILDNHENNSGDNASNYLYYQESNELGNGDDVRGVAVIPRSRSKFVCSRLGVGERDPSDHRLKDVAYFYIAYRHDPPMPTYDSFSVFLVPRAGATTTVVIIDPKIMNSG